jgi:hypothetical protein
MPLTDEIGFAMTAAMVAWVWWRNRQIAARHVTA